MNGIRTIAESVCFTLIVTGIFSLLVPSRTLEKVLKFAIGLFFLSSLVLPFTKGNLDFSFDFSGARQQVETRTLEQDVEQNFKGLAEKKVENQIISLLEKRGVSVKKVGVQIHIGEDNSIDISEIRIYLPSDSTVSPGEVSDMVEKEAGIKPEVVMQE